jgi:hypothetical protein
MFLREFIDEQSVDDAVIFHDELNPRFWRNGKMRPDVRYKLMQIALDFVNFIGIKKLGLTDVIVTGSNASYNYTRHSDIDLHLVVKMDEDDVMKQLFDAKKGLWNEQHNVKVKNHDVEVYVQDASEPHVSSGMYSLLNDSWIKEPKPVKPKIDDMSVEKKYHQYHDAINKAISKGSKDELEKIKTDIKKMRQGGLQTAGEFSAENLAFKILRNLGDMDNLMQALAKIKDQELSLEQTHKE